MGIIAGIKVMRLALGLCLLLVPESPASLCPHRRQYWHEQRERCVNCTACQAGQIVIRPCQVHRDAQCGPISSLNIDWSFLSRRAHKHHRKHHHGGHEINLLSLKAHHAHHAHHAIKPQSLYVDDDRVAKLALIPESAALRRIAVPTSSVSPLMVHAHTPPVPFSTAEKLVWDWQAVVLVLAVFACLLFFLVTGIYSIYHARNRRRFKGSFEADVEEAYARHSLMVAGNTGAPSLDPQGLCMDQLLVRKKQEDLGTTKGNFYIVRDKSRLSH